LSRTQTEDQFDIDTTAISQHGYEITATPRTLSQGRCFPKLEQYMHNRRNINAILSVRLYATLFPECVPWPHNIQKEITPNKKYQLVDMHTLYIIYRRHIENHFFVIAENENLEISQNPETDFFLNYIFSHNICMIK
jgi:hypothetical protein